MGKFHYNKKKQDAGLCAAASHDGCRATTEVFKAMAERFYNLTVAGIRRELPILNVTDTLAIAGFIMLGDVELTAACAQALAEKMPKETEVILTAETKGIPLAAELARCLGMKRYVVARKSVKAYMDDAVWVEDRSITTKGVQKLCLDGVDKARITGKNVLLLDDVVSTGGSMKALMELADKAGGKIVGEACVLAEGAAAERKDLIFLETLPLFDAQ